MDYKEIQELLRLVSRTNLTEVEIEKKDFKIRIRRKPPENNVIYTSQSAPMSVSPMQAPMIQTLPQLPDSSHDSRSSSDKPAEKQEVAGKNLYEFRSPMIGTFYRSPNPEVPPFAKVGDTVEKGQALCIIEAMKLFNEIESEVDGKIVKILVENAQPVEYDQPLFLIDTGA